MISFKNFLIEIFDKPVKYQIVGAPNFREIRYKFTFNDDDYYVGVVRGSRKAPSGSDIKTYTLTFHADFAYYLSKKNDTRGIIFEIDQQKLTQRYKVVPYSYFGTKDIGYLHNARAYPINKTFSKGKDYNFDNQFEEAVLSDIPKFSKYVTKVWVNRDTNPDIIHECERLGIPVGRLP